MSRASCCKLVLVVTLMLLIIDIDATRQHPNPRLDSACGGGKYVCDENGMLSANAYQSIEDELRALEKDYPIPCGEVQRGYQVGIQISGTPVLAPSEDIGTYAKGVFNSWGLGHKPCDNGVILIIAISERKTSIKTGKGARRVVTDRLAADVLSSSQMKYALRAANYDRATELAVSKLAAVLQRNDPGMYARASVVKLWCSIWHVCRYYKILDFWDCYWSAILAVGAAIAGSFWLFRKGRGFVL